MGDRLSIDPGKLFQTLKGTLMKADKQGREVTDEEVAAFVIVANQYQLNPFIRQIYAFPAKGGGIVPVVSVDGWIAIINRQKDLDGIEFETHTGDGNKLYAVTCAIHLKGRKFPVRVTEYLAECQRPTDPWNQMPHRMLRHKVLIQAARIAFGLTGIYDEDEGRDYAGQQTTATEPPLGRVNIRNGAQQLAERQPERQPPAAAPETAANVAEPSTF